MNEHFALRAALATLLAACAAAVVVGSATAAEPASTDGPATHDAVVVAAPMGNTKWGDIELE